MLTIDQVAEFDRDGFALVEGMFSAEEIRVLHDAIREASRVREHTITVRDVAGNEGRLALWRDVRDDVFGAFSTSPRIVNTIRALLRENVYHWHSKVMFKEANISGAWEWHQD